jgi:hypothetical protein
MCVDPTGVMHTEFEVAPLTAVVLLYLQLVLSVELAEKSACASFCLPESVADSGRLPQTYSSPRVDETDPHCARHSNPSRASLINAGARSLTRALTRTPIGVNACCALSNQVSYCRFSTCDSTKIYPLDKSINTNTSCSKPFHLLRHKSQSLSGSPLGFSCCC